MPLTASFSAHCFLKAVCEIVTLNSKNQIFIVGGTNFYLETLMSGLPFLAQNKTAEQIEKEKINFETIEKEFLAKGLAHFLIELKEKDKEYFEIVDKKNPRRVLRAISHLRLSKETFTAYRKKRERSVDFAILKFILYPSRNEMYANINRNVEQMFLRGWSHEVLKLKNKYQNNFKQMFNKNGLTSIGYLQILEYFQGKISLEDCIETIQRKTRKFAKQQISWLKRQNGIFLTQINNKEESNNSSTQEQWIKNVKDFRKEYQNNKNEFWQYNKLQLKLVNYHLKEIKKIIQQFTQKY